ncbi:malate synthase G [Erythrobacter arachoides]|uniref:Malate synthase G n=1 Tax=Aurantiacibacter arachoides TaxID=1850444 RepID=A0A845A5A7_9SPHN|nr:malate synthase G [Aurantiacibacter arachoides]MXO94117.1 malate synthase G [Aurantiacibacter arachoides]GGD65913.1 malate synthase G [Aurantiacibacter arachoides]
MASAASIDPAGTASAGTVGRAGLTVATALAAFVEDEALPGTGIAPDAFWQGFAALHDRFTPENRALLATREALQARIDDWHRANPDAGTGAPEAFLREIGYLVREPAPFRIATHGVDPEIARIAGPQLVVPVLNPRFLLNAANARWGSLYDAFYGTDALNGGAAPAGPYNAERGARVVAAARHFLDAACPLAEGSWADWQGGVPALADPSQLRGLRPTDCGTELLLANNGLHIELVIDRNHPIGAAHPAGLADVRLESALSTIVDLEDSVAAVDAEDKVAAYRNWLGLMQGTLEASFAKGGKALTRRLEEDRAWTAPDGSDLRLKGRALLLVRNVGHLMTTPAVLLPDGSEAFEGICDAAITCLAALHDRGSNSATGAIYVVKPKMHGPDECAFANDLFDAVEDMLGLPRDTIKIGVMDEERRTSANLAACIHAVRTRVFFINTGFLDRTGDEIHTAMLAGPVLPKARIKEAKWIAAYEARNVQIGLACGFAGRAQIGKGMWAAPDMMQAMVEQKIAHPLSGASTAWVPSPTAATLHAMHYHRVAVTGAQAARMGEAPAPLADLLTVPLLDGETLSPEAIAHELDTNVQAILGYVVRWVEQGVGCSKVPDLAGIGLMEDRATLRIASQHIGNWLLHGLVSEGEVDGALRRMAAKVDAQNAGDPAYVPMAGREGTSPAYRAARALVMEACEQPGGYTEPLLHVWRREAKWEGCA